MSLEIFGQKLRELRKSSGLTQASLARQLPTTAEMISIWERAYQHRGRRWVPDRSSALRLVEIFADQLTAQEAQQWLSFLDYKLGQAELQRFFPGEGVLTSFSASPSANSQAILKRLVGLPDQRLFGVSQAQQQLRLLLEQTDAPWLISIDGIGGIGKTSLAAAVAQEIMLTNRFKDMAWVSAKQHEFLPGSSLEPTNRPVLTVEALVAELLEQVAPAVPLTLSAQEKKFALTRLLKQELHLVVIDNLETLVDYQTLLPDLRHLANPSKFILTSRHSLQTQPDVFCRNLAELSWPDALSFIRYEASTRGLVMVAEAAEADLNRIYDVVGGNPLALKLVIGQLSVLPLSQVLDNIKQARGQTVDELYTYIYWQAWQLLDPAGRHTLLMMPLAQEGPLAQLLALTRLDITDLSRALHQLVGLSLVQVSGDLEDRRYAIHRLTETFLLREVAKWQASP